MRVVHISYNVPQPNFTDPEAWLKRVNASTGFLESMGKRHEVITVYHTAYRGQLKRNNVHYYFTGLQRFHLLLPLRLNAFIRKLAPEAVVVHGLIFPFQLILLRRQLKRHTRIVVQHHAERPLEGIRARLQRIADPGVHAYLFCALELGKRWVEKGLIQRSEKLREVMEVSSVFHPIDRVIARSDTGVAEGEIYLWVGRLHQPKDPMTVIKAFITFNRTNPLTHLYLIYSSNELLDDVINYIEINQAGKFIHLIGKVDHEKMLSWYNSADFIVSGSFYEGSGTAVCEGISCGCIPVLSNIPTFRMMTRDGEAGLLFEAGNAEELTAKLSESVLLNKTEWRKKVLDQFDRNLSSDAIAKRMEDIICE